MARPVEVLRAVRSLLNEGASLVIADGRVAETFTAPGDDFERYAYAWSVLHCPPASRTETPSAARGTALRPDTVRRYAAEAGFTTGPIDHDFWRF